MKLKSLGRSGLFVSELCLGTMTFGGGSEGLWGKIGQTQQVEADALFGAAIETGINFNVTADVYAAGRSEQITGQALRNHKVARDDVAIATMVLGETGPDPGAHCIGHGDISISKPLPIRHVSSARASPDTPAFSALPRFSGQRCAPSPPRLEAAQTLCVLHLTPVLCTAISRPRCACWLAWQRTSHGRPA